MWLPSHSQHEQRCPSLILVSTALFITVSLLATYFNSTWHFLSRKHIKNFKSVCRMVSGGAASIHMPHRFPACPSEFPTLLSPRLQACSLQCLEIPQICPQHFSLSLCPGPCFHSQGEQPGLTAKTLLGWRWLIPPAAGQGKARQGDPGSSQLSRALFP